MNWLVQTFLYFIIYSFVGYIWEVCFVAIQTKGKQKNRGYLFGPVCPIYGFALILVLWFTDLLSWPVWTNFFLIILICASLEYWTSFLMEKLFHLRWWDYSNKFMNLHGRICLLYSIGFGVGGMVAKYILQPGIAAFISLFSPLTQFIVAVVLFVALMVDFMLSTFATASLKDNLRGGRADLTAEIKKYAINYYRKQSRLRRKIAKQSIRRMNKIQRETRKHFKKMQKQAIHNFKKMQRNTKKRLKQVEKARNDYKRDKEQLKRELRKFKQTKKRERESYKILSRKNKKNLKQNAKLIKRESKKIIK